MPTNVELKKFIRNNKPSACRPYSRLKKDDLITLANELGYNRARMPTKTVVQKVKKSTAFKPRTIASEDIVQKKTTRTRTRAPQDLGTDESRYTDLINRNYEGLTGKKLIKWSDSGSKQPMTKYYARKDWILANYESDKWYNKTYGEAYRAKTGKPWIRWKDKKGKKGTPIDYYYELLKDAGMRD